MEGPGHPPDRGQKSDPGLERAMRGIEAALQLALDVAGSADGGSEEARRGVQHHIAAARAEVEELRALAPHHELLRLWASALAAIAGCDGDCAPAPEVDGLRSLVRRLKQDPPRSLSSQTLHGGIGLKSLIGRQAG